MQAGADTLDAARAALAPGGERLEERCKRLEAYQTPRWAIEAVLDVELTTNQILDPCAGLGAIGEVCADRGFAVEELDIEDWREVMPEQARLGQSFWKRNFFDERCDLSNHTVIMNPPFSLAEDFVSYAQTLNARKIICFQRQAWRESVSRRLWWESNAPARVWVCGARATCWRFDMLGTDAAKKSGSTTSHAWYVWERGHRDAELTGAIYPLGKP